MPTTVLDRTKVNAMRLAFLQNPKLDRHALASLYGINTSHLNQILRGYVWKDRNYTPPRGSFMPKARLTWTEVRAIRHMRLDGHTLKVIAELYGVTTVCIHNICHGHTWRNDPIDGLALPIVPMIGRIVTTIEDEAA